MRFGHTIAESYERYFVPVIAEPLARDLLGQVRPRAGERVLDVACGTGIVARLAAGMVGAAGSVTGIDINPGMLDVAKAVSSDLSPTIEWMESDAEEHPFPAESFDLVTCQLSLQFIGNKPVAMKEMHRVLKKSGRVGIALPGRAGEVFGIFMNELGDHISPEAAGFARQIFSLYDLDMLQSLLEEAGFRKLDLETYEKFFTLPLAKEFLWQYISSTPLAGQVQVASEDARQALERNIVERWAQFEANGVMTYPQTIIIATAEA